MAFGRARRARVDEHRAADPAAVRAGALALLGRREYASGELASALIRKGYAAEMVTEVVAELAGEHLLDDARYAESLVRQLAGRGQGPARIRQELREAGLPEEQVTTVIEAGPDWGELAGEVRRRKFGAGRPVDWPERARQMRFLQYRGFSKDHIASALGGSGAEDPGDAGDSPDDDP
jgi:regulatory protein